MENLILFFGEKARKCLEIISTYIKKNPDLKYFSKESTTIKNKRYFSVLHGLDLIEDIEVVYWYGFLSADGSLYIDAGNYVIYFGLKYKDRDRVYRFAEVVGFTEDRVNTRTTFRSFKGRLIESKRTEVRFGSKTMYKDIMAQGFTSSHDKKKNIPEFVYSLISKANEEAFKQIVHWWYTRSGMLALAWLLGLYDGDGTLKDKKYGLLISGREEFLDLIAETFDCIHRAKSKGEPSGFSSSESYNLCLGTDLFDAMLNSYEKSMGRKRPRNWRFGSNVRTYFD